GAAVPVAIEVTPASAVLHDPSDRAQIHVRATFSDGTKRDVTQLACFEPSNLLVKVDGGGAAVRAGFGECAVLVGYLDRQAGVRLALVPARPGFPWKPVPENNYIDRHVFAKLRTLREQPSELCADSVFLRRAFLDTLGVLPTPAETRRFLADRRSDKRS